MKKSAKKKKSSASVSVASAWKSSDQSVSYRASGYPFYLVTRVSSRYYLAMESEIKEIGMDLPRWRVMLILSEIGQASVSEIGAHAVSKLSTITKTVQRLEGDGLVSTRPRPSDARVTEVQLTARGRAVVEKVRPRGRQVFEQAFAGFDDQSVAELVHLLEQVFANLE